MVGTAAHQKFFQPEETAPDGDWHAYREDSAVALCQQASLRYNVDRIADAVPSGGHLCNDCAAVLSGAEPVTEAIVDEPVVGPVDITLGEAGPEVVATPGGQPPESTPEPTAVDPAGVPAPEPVEGQPLDSTTPEDQTPAG